MERVALAGRYVRPIRLSAVDMINLAVETRTTPMAIGAVLIIPATKRRC